MSEKLLANKFKSAEDLETGYMNLQSAHNQNTAKVQTLESQLAEYKIPDDYAAPEGVQINDADMAANKALAKKAGLSQKQFNELLSGIGEVATANHQKAQESARAAEADRAAKRAQLDQQELGILEKFVPEAFGDELGEVLKQKLHDPQVFEKIKGIRAKLTSNATPGISIPSAPPVSDYSEEEFLKAQKLAAQNPSNMVLRDRHIELLNQRIQHKKRLTNQ